MSNRLSLGQAFIFLLRRDLLLALRNRAEYAMPLLFFVLVITMFRSPTSRRRSWRTWSSTSLIRRASYVLVMKYAFR